MKHPIVRRTRKEVLKLWVEALRSKKYRQTTGQLKEVRHGHSYFCCLGVLCDLARKDGGPKWELSWANTPANYLEMDSTLPDVIAEFVGLDDEAQEWLIELNDEKGAKFSEIADKIEAQYLKPFKK